MPVSIHMSCSSREGNCDTRKGPEWLTVTFIGSFWDSSLHAPRRDFPPGQFVPHTNLRPVASSPLQMRLPYRSIHSGAPLCSCHATCFLFTFSAFLAPASRTFQLWKSKILQCSPAPTGMPLARPSADGHPSSRSHPRKQRSPSPRPCTSFGGSSHSPGACTNQTGDRLCGGRSTTQHAVRTFRTAGSGSVLASSHPAHW